MQYLGHSSIERAPPSASSAPYMNVRIRRLCGSAGAARSSGKRRQCGQAGYRRRQVRHASVQGETVSTGSGRADGRTHLHSEPSAGSAIAYFTGLTVHTTDRQRHCCTTLRKGGTIFSDHIHLDGLSYLVGRF